ncbi:MAG: trypsin-like peptidase domain-containing protein [Thermoleophilaceae bacterium]
MQRRILTLCAVVGAFALAPATASAWAPADEATIHPGVMTFTEGGQCTSNFIVTDGSNVYIGQAAHCSGTGTATETDGCDSGSHPIGTEVEIEGASQPGTMVYNSWIAMQDAGETDSETCQYNDFALVRIHPDDVPNVNPSVPDWGGPTGIGTSSSGETVYTYGNSSLRGGATVLSPKEGTTVGVSPEGWSYDVYTATPGIPGDSGSAFLNDDGQALGVLATVQIAPLAGSNGVGDFGKELAYAQAHGLPGAELALGTEPFQPGILASLGGLGL